MIREGLARFFHPENRLLWILPWLAGYAFMLVSGWTGIVLQLFPDPDDAMRLLQVRDWLGGQRWFDVTQYRISPPEGVHMHWSRLVDLPIAAVIMLSKPFLGQSGAEMAALLLVPMLTLGVLMFLVGTLARRLLPPVACLFAVAATPFSIAAIIQLAPLRIDHHGWQMVLGVVMAIAALSERDRRAGLIAGSAGALWLNISAEALPFVGAVGAWFAFRWLRGARAADRLRFYSLALTAISLLLFVIVRAPQFWSEKACDAVSSAHLGAFLAGSTVCFVAVRTTIQSIWKRLGVLAAAGLAGLAAIYLGNSECLQDPFASLDPVVRHYWYNRVMEGLPVWRQKPLMILATLIQPAVGIAGTALALACGRGEQRKVWETYLFLLLAATLASLMVMRAASLANIFSLPGTAFLSWTAFQRARAMQAFLPRVFATVFALFLMLPAYVVPLSIPSNLNASANKPEKRSTVQRCMSRHEMELLRALPVGDIAAPLDISPAILVHTGHRVIASSHHRNMAGMRDAIQLFISPATRSQYIIADRDIEYVVACPEMAEVKNFSSDNPAGLWADLAAGKDPSWLEPVSVPGVQQLRIWRVRKDKLTGVHPQQI